MCAGGWCGDVLLDRTTTNKPNRVRPNGLCQQQHLASRTDILLLRPAERLWPCCLGCSGHHPTSQLPRFLLGRRRAPERVRPREEACLEGVEEAVLCSGALSKHTATTLCAPTKMLGNEGKSSFSLPFSCCGCWCSAVCGKTGWFLLNKTNHCDTANQKLAVLVGFLVFGAQGVLRLHRLESAPKHRQSTLIPAPVVGDLKEAGRLGCLRFLC